ncbi:hypothetical protein PMAYCL1PPCAC_01529, partial [Pristionchus mayeri]
ESKSGEVEEIPLFEAVTPNDIKEELEEFTDEPIDDLEQNFLEVPIDNMSRRMCVVCRQFRNENKMREFTKNSTRRTLWVEAVRSTPERRRSLMELLSTRKTSYLCACHFSPSDFKQTSRMSNRYSMLRLDAIPYFQDSESKSGEVEEIPLFEAVTPNDIKEELEEFTDEPIDDLEQNFLEVPIDNMSRRMCVVCRQFRNENKMREFTKNSTRRTLWVEAVRSTPERRRSLMELLSTRKTSYLCACHFSPSDFKQTSRMSNRYSMLRLDAIPYFQ